MKVSIMMPAYNAGKYLDEAVRSVISQTYENWELVIVDDGSEDETLQIAESWQSRDPRIRAVGIEHSGCPVARNVCFAHCTGEIIARQDADDLQDGDRIYEQVGQLLRGGSDIVTCKFSWLEGERLIPKKSYPMDPKVYMNGGPGPVCASIVALRHVYEKVGDFNPDLKAGSDGDWNFRAILTGVTWDYVPKHLYIQRRHPGQISKRLTKEQRRNHNLSRIKWRKAWQS